MDYGELFQISPICHGLFDALKYNPFSEKLLPSGDKNVYCTVAE
jgi:hypothetical protein